MPLASSVMFFSSVMYLGIRKSYASFMLRVFAGCLLASAFRYSSSASRRASSVPSEDIELAR